MSKANIYTVGGTVQANQNGIYLTRKADEELLVLCRERKFAYVLTPRQMGKSSLMVHTAQRLTQEGIQSVIIDLTSLGTQVKDEEWFLGLISEIADQLMLDTDIFAWWQSFSHLSFTQRLTHFLQKILLVEIASPIVIFIDEIDSTLSLDFTDDLFAAIRYTYNARVQKPEFHRLSFVLIGVATPGDLIKDPKRTPFNIGQRVDLTYFTFEEALSLTEGLGLQMQEPQQVIKWLLKWTGGHPYLTQYLCRAITEQNKSSWSETEIDDLVQNNFLSPTSKQENNLLFVRDMLTLRAPDLFRVLTTYRDILRGKPPIPDEERSLIKSHLKLSGIVCANLGVLKVSNRIYQKVFDNKWIKQHLPIPSKLLTFRTVFIISLFVTGFTQGIRQLGWLQPWELQAYDQMLRSRPVDKIDNRLLVVNVTEEDIQSFDNPLPTTTINKLLVKLESYQPRVIGLNLYRPNEKGVGASVVDKSKLIVSCKFSSLKNSEIAPPSGFKQDNIGFNDLIPDSSDRTVRRALLFGSSEKNNKCTTEYSFAALVSLAYLEKQGINFDFNKNKDLVVGGITIPRLQGKPGSYEHVDLGGYQILLNYRHPDYLARQVTLTQILNNQINPDWVKDKLVIIGNAASSIDRGISTPYSVLPNQPSGTPGTLIQAQIASNILSIVLDNKPLIWYWSDFVEIAWVWLWALVGGILMWQVRQAIRLGLTALLSGSILSGVCYLIFLQGGWIPVVPPAIAFIISATSVTSTTYLIRVRLINKNSK